jgi:hypothetical protein
MGHGHQRSFSIILAVYFQGFIIELGCCWQTCYMGMEKYILVIFLASLLQIEVSFQGGYFYLHFESG